MPGYANPQNLNRYSYVTNNPLRYTDPTGHERLQDGPVDDDFSQSVFDDYEPLPDNDNEDDDNPGSDNNPDDLLLQDEFDECQTVTCKALSGDIYSMIELLIPSHLGWRIQIEGTIFIFSGTVGVNGVFNFVENQFGASADWSLGGGPGYGAGAAVTTGPLVGWGSSNVEDVTTGNSVVLSGSAAAELALTGAVSAPVGNNGLYIDPYYGQTPATLYLGGGAGGAFADAGLSYSGTLGTWLP